MDPVSAMLVTFGIVCLLASWVLLLIVSFRHDYTWGLVTLFLPPLSYFYSLFATRQSAGALLFAIIGIGLILLSTL